MLVLMNGEGRVGMDAAVLALEAGKSALDVVEAGIRPVEADPAVRTVGFGGYPNLAGVVECDAAIMDGVTRECGSVGALSGYLHAIQVARQVMERLPHVMLVGDGAARFAAEVGATEAEMLSEESEVWHRQRQSARLANALNGREALAAFCWPKDGLHTARGTTVLLCRDKEGRLAGGTSTSGWAHKYPGRLGDSPIIGAGLYVDQRYGACACTHTGEMTIRAGTARAVVAAMCHGASVQDACHEALEDLLQLRAGFLGSVVIHAISATGETCVLSTHDFGPETSWCHWRKGMQRWYEMPPEVGSLKEDSGWSGDVAGGLKHKGRD